jgi:hypothetical protein
VTSGSGRPPQVNIRLDPADAEVLATLAFLNDSSAAEVLRPVIQRFLRSQRGNPEIQAALEIRRRRNDPSG